MTCTSLMTAPADHLDSRDTVAQAVDKMLRTGQTVLAVTEADGRLKGTFGLKQAVRLILPVAARLDVDLGDLAYFGEGLADLTRRYGEAAQATVGEHTAECDTVHETAAAMEALLLLSRGDGLLPVVDDRRRLVGVITAAHALSVISGAC
ncbi:MAG: CBS domain-containing protein [Solirubrobacterales bacterium]